MKPIKLCFLSTSLLQIFSNDTRCGTSFSQYRWYCFQISVPSDKVRVGQGVYTHVMFGARGNLLIPNKGSGQMKVVSPRVIALESMQFPGSYLDAGGDRKVWMTKKDYSYSSYSKWKKIIFDLSEE